ncbi:hypothetical protein [Brevundimonas sp. LjRoot202]|uniref:hypothetical protein n=1 Tax=Brevundimonas sp. LjRoot202 TaxID=3342281 RepID=UPI003ECCF11F
MTRAALIAPIAALTLALGAAGVAHACMRPIDGPGEWMDNRYSTVAVATIVEVRSRSAERPNRSWTAVAEVTRVVEGFPQTGRYRLEHEERTECPRVLPLPVEGETWTLYMEGMVGEGGTVHQAWPLTWSERLDARFGGDPEAEMRDLEPPRG